MSKLLILFLLHRIWSVGLSLSVIYSEAEIYGPTEDEFAESFAAGQFGQNILVEFLFSGVYEPVIPSEFAGSGPIGDDRALIGFLGYNKRQILGAASIVPFRKFIPIVGVPSRREWSWREEAVIKINDTGLLTTGQRISSISKVDLASGDASSQIRGEARIHVSIQDYRETLVALLQIFEALRYSHFLTLAPFGSKMQTVGAFLFTRLHPETQIVYACPRDYHPRYSERTADIWEIKFQTPSLLMSELLLESDPNIAKLNSILAVAGG